MMADKSINQLESLSLGTAPNIQKGKGIWQVPTMAKTPWYAPQVQPMAKSIPQQLRLDTAPSIVNPRIYAESAFGTFGTRMQKPLQPSIQNTWQPNHNNNYNYKQHNGMMDLDEDVPPKNPFRAQSTFIAAEPLTGLEDLLSKQVTLKETTKSWFSFGTYL